MYQKVLVPLDGSELAERALPELMKLCRGGVIGEVIVLKVNETEVLTLPKAYDRSIDFAALRNARCAESMQYLEGIQARLQADGVKVRTELLEGNPEDKIVDYANSHGVDLIIIGTHGYTGMKRLVFGSVALQVLHDAYVPVLLVRTKPAEEKPGSQEK